MLYTSTYTYKVNLLKVSNKRRLNRKIKLVRDKHKIILSLRDRGVSISTSLLAASDA